MATAAVHRSSSVREGRAPGQGGILLNGPGSPRAASETRAQGLRIATDSDTNSSLSTSRSPPFSPDSATSVEGDTAPLKLRFSTPLPSSGKKRSNSITLGVASRAQLLSAQNGGAPVQRAQPMPQPQLPPPWHQGGQLPSDVYTVSDAKSGLKKAWSKVKRKRRTSQGSVTSTSSEASTDSSVAESVIEEEAEPPQTRSGEATPRRRASPTPHEMTRRNSADGPSATKSKADILGFPQERTHDHATEYESELWRGRRQEPSDETSSTVSEEDSRSSRSSNVDDEEEDAADKLADMKRKTSSAAGYEVVERQKRT